MSNLFQFTFNLTFAFTFHIQLYCGAFMQSTLHSQEIKLDLYLEFGSVFERGIVRRLSMLEGPPWSPLAPSGPLQCPPFPAQSLVLRGPPMEFRSHRGGGNSTLESIHALSPALLCHTKQCHGSRSSAGHCICARRAIVFVWTSNCIWSPGHHWKYRISGAFPHAIVMTSVSDVVTIITAVTADPRLMLKNAFIH